MKQIYPDLWQTEAEHPFSGVTSHAYLLTKEDGNVLFYSSGVTRDYDEMASLGGVAWQYLSHRDEAGPSLLQIKQRFGSQLCCHRLEEKSIRQTAPIDCLFDEREVRLGNVEIIPTPGHTEGSVCFFVRLPKGGKYLFTGDSIYMNDGVWEVRINRFSLSAKSAIKKSLLLLRDLDPSVVISSASMGSAAYKEVTPDEWRSIVDGVIGGL